MLIWGYVELHRHQVRTPFLEPLSARKPLVPRWRSVLLTAV